MMTHEQSMELSKLQAQISALQSELETLMRTDNDIYEVIDAEINFFIPSFLPFFCSPVSCPISCSCCFHREKSMLIDRTLVAGTVDLRGQCP